MGILGNAVKGSIKDQESGKVLTTNQIGEIQKVLLMVLEDIDNICRKNDLHYVLIGGTAIGCVRHKGFIPWDDDVDVAMTRTDYEKFRKIIQENYLDKYSVTDAIRENNFGKNIPKLRLKGTIYNTLLKIESEDKEITADIFIIENVENSNILKYIHGFLCLIMGYALSCRRLAEYKDFFIRIFEDKVFKRKVAVGSLLKFASLDKWAHWTENVYSLCKNDNSKFVTVPTDRRHFLGEIFRREVLCEAIDADFEGRSFMIPKEYDYYLSQRYGKYMQIPSADKQVLSVYSELDFGPYKNLALRR